MTLENDARRAATIKPATNWRTEELKPRSKGQVFRLKISYLFNDHTELITVN